MCICRRKFSIIGVLRVIRLSLRELRMVDALRKLTAGPKVRMPLLRRPSVKGAMSRSQWPFSPYIILCVLMRDCTNVVDREQLRRSELPLSASRDCIYGVADSVRSRHLSRYIAWIGMSASCITTTTGVDVLPGDRASAPLVTKSMLSREDKIKSTIFSVLSQHIIDVAFGWKSTML